MIPIPAVAASAAPLTFEAVVSNPPYVAHRERADVEPEVLWEPAHAVFCDGEPREVYAAVARGAAPLVRAGGLLLLELPGDDPRPVVAAVAADGAWGAITLRDDLAGRPRVLRAVRSGAA